VIGNLGGVSASSVIQDVAAIATAGGFLAAAVALRQARRLSRAQNFFSLAQFLQAPDVRDARRRILDAQDCGSIPTRWLDPEAGPEDHQLVQAAGLVASSYDLTGRVVELGYVDREPFLDDWGPSIKKLHKVLGPFLRERRVQHADNRYFDNFERLAASVTWWEHYRAATSWRRRLRYVRERPMGRRTLARQSEETRERD